ncbi:MAG: ATP synthase F1 subunit gamma [Planctomyces sp.]|nr:ATP synthase F1 subunit gamma [Planctomyces sp.]MBA4040068.1 ATP synthase F1 subunit gamma [Planctomyces sp.]MBA4119900.1 ATP synthase F1 subunit gamma [Isosphaera sp.]
MAKTREIKKRIKAVSNIRRITRTMQMIATSKFARAQAAATATKPYTEGLFALVTELAASAGDLQHPLISGPPDGAPAPAGELTLVLTSDRGLCGPYNASILRTLMQHLRSAPGNVKPPAGGVEVVGKKGAGFLKYNDIAVTRQHTQFGDKPSFDAVAALADEYMELFTTGKVAAVRVAFMRFLSAGRQSPEVLQLLPLKPIRPAATPATGPAINLQYEFSPPAPELLGSLLPETVRATLFQVFNDAVVSEHVARMVAMKGATDNAGKMRKLYTRDFNRARQAQITTELSEIISGAAALG